MSDAGMGPHSDGDAWATACAEDLAAERARRRELAGGRPGGAADELRRLADAVVDKLAELRTPAAEMAAKAVISQVKAASGQLKDRNPGVFDHLAAAGSELLAAYRAAVAGSEQRWTQEASGGGTAARPGPSADGRPAPAADGSGGPAGDDDGRDHPGPERIDLD